MGALLADLRYAFRSLTRSPSFTAAAVATLALGIGANAAVFGVLDRLLFRAPSHVRDSGRVMRVYFTQTHPRFGASTGPVTSWSTYANLRDGVHSAEFAAFYEGDVSAGRGQDAQKARASLVSHTYFGLLGVAPALGRFFVAAEDHVSAEPVAVLGHGYWRRRFGADSTVLGRTIWLGTDPFTVIGVAPRGFTGVGLRDIDLWLPIERANSLVFGRDVVGNAISAAGSFWLRIIARVPEGESPAAVEQAMAPVYRRSIAGRPFADPNATVDLGPLQEARGPQPDQTADVSKWLAAVALIVLLIACANAANLMLASAVRRRPEVAVRLALGGGRRRVLRLLFLEHLGLAVVAGGVALLVTAWTGPLLRALLLPSLPSSGTVVDVRVFGLTVAVTLAAGVLAGLVPAWQGSRVDLISTLKSESRGAERRSLARNALLLTQVALTVTLLAGAGLFVRSLQEVRGLDLGLDPARVLVATMDLEEAGRTRQEINDLFLRMRDRLGRLPNVEHVAASVGHPFGSTSGMSVQVPGRDSMPRLNTGGPYYSMVTPGYFETVGTDILRGRGFTASDRAGSARVVVVSATLAKLGWPDEDPLGRCVLLGSDTECYEVVGVAEDARRFRAVEEPFMHVYVPMGQWGERAITALFIRASRDPESLITPVRREMQGLEPDLPFADVQLLQDRVDPTIRPWRLAATLFSAFGALALAVAAFGLYGVLGYLVAQRTREIGVRMALGADATSVVRLVIGQGLRMTMLGAVLGLAGGFLAGRALSALLYDVSPADPATYLAVTGVLVIVAVVASYFPARRAVSVDPMAALRYE